MRTGQRQGFFPRMGQNMRGIIGGAARIGGRILKGVATAGAVAAGVVALNSALNYDSGGDVQAAWASGRAMTPNLQFGSPAHLATIV
jgi:hypothetical protein